MSIELANEKWLDGKGKGLLGQFASTRGYSDLIAAVKGRKYPVLKEFFNSGVTGDVERARAELKKLADDPKTDADVATTANALRDLADGQEVVVITDGAY
jgi:hypothetical protein